MGMETDRSPVIDPGAPSEQIYRILVRRYANSARDQCRRAGGVALEGIGTAEIRTAVRARSAFAFISLLMSDTKASPSMAYHHGLLWRLEKSGPRGVVLPRVAEKLRAGMPCDISSHGASVLPCRAPRAIEGQEDLDWQVAAFDAMALPGPSAAAQIERGSARVPSASLRFLSSSATSAGAPTPIRAALRGSLYSTIGRSSPCAAGSLILSAACVRLRACRGRPCTCTLESTACAAEMRDFRVHRNGPAITRARPLEPFAIGSA